jgi:ketosteroid isomerase-like protein
MSRENVETVERAIAALNARDIDGYLACCTEDIELRLPLVGGVYEGPEGIRRFLTDIDDVGPDFRIEIESLKTIGDDQVLAFVQTSSTGRASGIQTGADTTNVYDLVAGNIRRVRIFFDRREALEAVGLRE